MVGNNDCTWRCTGDYYGASVGTGVSFTAIGGECSLCDATPCPAGQYRDTCAAGSNADATCVSCTPPPLFSSLGVATPYNADQCAILCNFGWYNLPDQRFCCSDNAYINSGTTCTCSAGFRVGQTLVDGADCVP